VDGCSAVQVKIAFMNTQMVCQLLIINLLILSSFSTKKESGFTARGQWSMPTMPLPAAPSMINVPFSFSAFHNYPS
jgi:hypothetical protein